MTIARQEKERWVLQLFAGSWSAMCALASWLLVKTFPDSLAWLWLLVGTLFFAAGLICPSSMRWPYRLVERVLGPVGEIFSLIMLAVVYFGIFAPFAVVLRVSGWDPLRLRHNDRVNSAWVNLDDRAGETDYFWQY